MRHRERGWIGADISINLMTGAASIRPKGVGNVCLDASEAFAVAKNVAKSGEVLPAFQLWESDLQTRAKHFRQAKTSARSPNV
jgi:hypothetical protein